MFFSCKFYSSTIESNNTTKRHIGFAESQYGILYGAYHCIFISVHVRLYNFGRVHKLIR